MLGLPAGRNDGRGPWSPKKIIKRLGKEVMRSYKFRLPKYDLPLRLRPWFIVFTTVIMLILAFLGFTNVSHGVPINDKVLHLVCMCLATTVFYFIFDVEEEARRIWFWRHSPLILTGIICFLFGGILSEVVQGLLPHKEFQIGDIIANLLGSAVGLYAAYNLERYYRHRREIARLYRPVALDDEVENELSEDEEIDSGVGGTMLLPMYQSRSSSASAASPHSAKSPYTNGNGNSKSSKTGKIRLGDVWDEREELFGIGDSDDDDDMPAKGSAKSRQQGEMSTSQSAGPKIIVTSS